MEVGGEAIFVAIFEASPTLQALFTTARGIHARRFMSSLNSCIKNLEDPSALRIQAETLGFSHMSVDVQSKHVSIFRNAVTDVLAMELGDNFDMVARQGFRDLLSYIGGALIYVKNHYAERLKILVESWNKCNDDDSAGNDQAYSGDVDDGGGEGLGHDNAAEEIERRL